MKLTALVVLVVAPSAACTLIYDVDNLPGATDAPVVIDAPPDSNPANLALTSVEPTHVLEGTGAANGRPALFVLHGAALVGDAQVTVAFADAPDAGAGGPTLAAYDASLDGTQAGVAIAIPVLPELAAGASRTMTITIAQGGTSASLDVTVDGLAELTLASGGSTVDAVTTYSSIAITGKAHFTGDAPVRLFATGGIELAAALDGDADGQTGGPHGCKGGNAGAVGTCTPGGGGAGKDAGALGLQHGAGGGGGGFGALGTAGDGTGGGGPGALTGTETLVPIVSTAGVAGNRGNGGGGGGAGLLNAAGGPGGGGGGVIYLAAGGDITVTGGGAIAATGATATGGSGGGGGGSGGAILVRAGGAITAPGVWLSAEGGKDSVGAEGAGGPGGVGRIRVDTPAGDVAAMASTPSAFRGPSWATSTPSVTSTRPTLTLVGQPGRAFGLRLNDTAAGEVTPGVDGTVVVPSLPLVVGRNQLCAVAQPGSLLPESLSCVELFYAGR